MPHAMNSSELTLKTPVPARQTGKAAWFDAVGHFEFWEFLLTPQPFVCYVVGTTFSCGG
jgi:hypothetical protein